MPRVVDHAARREEIAEAAWRLIEREGYERASLRAISREAGYTTGVLTHYFRGRRELISFVFGLVVERQTGRLAREMEDSGMLEALAQLLPLDTGRRRECAVWLTLMGASLSEPELVEEFARRYRRARETMMPVFARVLGEESEDLIDQLLAAVDGLTVDALADPGRYPPRRQRELLQRILARYGVEAGRQP